MLIILIQTFVILVLTNGEYQIKELRSAIYLNYTFHNLSEEIFPIDIIITLSLSRVVGTLLYSVDSNSNQLIVTLNEINTAALDIEFNNQRHFVYIDILCGNKGWRYIRLRIRIQVRDMIYIQCNDEKIVSYTFHRNGGLNRAYPIPKFTKSDKLQAFMWMVNIPYMDRIYPNNDQLSGCIFEVMYKKKPLQMGTHDVGNKCPITCNADICNTGQCLETHNKYPICNCTESFMNGQFCNESLNTRYCDIAQRFQFKELKLSFKDEYSKIFLLKNERVQLQVESLEENLFFIIRDKRTFDTTLKTSITTQFELKEANILILVLEIMFVIIKFRAGNSQWSYISVPYHDLSKEKFETIILPCKGGYIDMRYKNDAKEIRWNQLSKVDHFCVIPSSKSTNETLTEMALRVDFGKKVTYKSSYIEVNSVMHNLEIKVSDIGKLVIGLMVISILCFILIMLRLTIIIMRKGRMEVLGDSSQPLNRQSFCSEPQMVLKEDLNTQSGCYEKAL